MSEINDGGTTCSRCEEKAVRKQGHQWLCSMHYRFGQMRQSARRHDKAVPSHEQLANLFYFLTFRKCNVRTAKP